MHLIYIILLLLWFPFIQRWSPCFKFLWSTCRNMDMWSGKFRCFLQRNNRAEHGQKSLAPKTNRSVKPVWLGHQLLPRFITWSLWSECHVSCFCYMRMMIVRWCQTCNQICWFLRYEWGKPWKTAARRSSDGYENNHHFKWSTWSSNEVRRIA